MNESFAGKRVLITGASGGIGSVVSRLLASRGAELVLIGRDEAKLEHLASQLTGGPHSSVALDVADENSWRECESVINQSGKLHGLVTAAAQLAPIGQIGTWKASAFQTTLEINVVGTVLAIIASLDALKADHGSIVTFSGGGGTTPLPRFDAYAASKAAVARLTENISVELSSYGVRANCIAPGFIATDIHKETLSAGPEVVGSDYYERTAVAIQSGGDSPDRAAELVSFLLSDASSGITGKLISAPWDPWDTADYQQRLRADKHLATLRRIDEFYFSVTEK